MVIDTKSQLISNLDRVECYLSSVNEELYNAMAQYIARGRVFVTYIVDGKYHFAPSRFVGYKDNTLVKHQNNEEKDGRITTPAIISPTPAMTRSMSRHSAEMCRGARSMTATTTSRPTATSS